MFVPLMQINRYDLCFGFDLDTHKQVFDSIDYGLVIVNTGNYEPFYKGVPKADGLTLQFHDPVNKLIFISQATAGFEEYDTFYFNTYFLKYTDLNDINNKIEKIFSSITHIILDADGYDPHNFNHVTDEMLSKIPVCDLKKYYSRYQRASFFNDSTKRRKLFMPTPDGTILLDDFKDMLAFWDKGHCGAITVHERNDTRHYVLCGSIFVTFGSVYDKISNNKFHAYVKNRMSNYLYFCFNYSYDNDRILIDTPYLAQCIIASDLTINLDFSKIRYIHTLQLTVNTKITYDLSNIYIARMYLKGSYDLIINADILCTSAEYPPDFIDFMYYDDVIGGNVNDTPTRGAIQTDGIVTVKITRNITKSDILNLPFTISCNEIQIRALEGVTSETIELITGVLNKIRFK